MATPLVSIIMPTLNSARTIRLALSALRRQEIPARDLEVIIVDGGSTDETREIARSFGCKVLENSKVLPEYAKSVGLQAARGRFGVFLDSDEEIVDTGSLRKKVLLLDSVATVHSVITAGLSTPEGLGVVSDYANRFGDPFSFFMYRLDGGNYLRSFRERCEPVFEDQHAVVFRFPNAEALPICDGGGHFFRLERLRQVADLTDPAVVSQVFTCMAKEHRQLALVKRDFVRHYSTATVRGLLHKIDWRVVGNVHYPKSGATGHSTREEAQPKGFSRKKLLFVPYALTVVGPLIDAIAMSVRYGHAGYLIHVPIAAYTAGDILWHMSLRAVGVRPKWGAYGAR